MAAPKADFDAVPVIDFALSKTDRAEYFKQLKFACEDVGFGVFKNVPGFEDSYQKQIFELADKLFTKPQEWKDALSTSESPALRGYWHAGRIEAVHKAHAEAFRFGSERPAPGALDDPSVPFWLKLHEGPNQWPSEEDIPRFRHLIEIFFENMREFILVLTEHLSEHLGVPNSVLEDYFPDDAQFTSVFWHYFPCTAEMRQEAKNDFVTGIHEHRDPSTFFTLLIQNRLGLQAQNHKGVWIDIPMVEGGVVFNIGMPLDKFTGGKMIATNHRVNTLKVDAERYTLGYARSTKLDKRVIPLPQFASPESAKMHSAPNPKMERLMAVKDPLTQSGYARMLLFPAAAKKLYPKEYEEARQMGIV